MKKLLSEFKTFALRGNVIDLSVGVIIGAAFQGIVKSLTDNILSPLIGLFVKLDLSDLKLTLFGTVDIRYGAFLTTAINFVIVAFLIFLLVKGMNKLSGLGKKREREPEPPQAPVTRECPYCRSEIALKATRCPNCTSILNMQE